LIDPAGLNGPGIPETYRLMMSAGQTFIGITKCKPR